MSVRLVENNARPPERVLIIKPSALGDVVTAMPVLRALKRKYPTAHVSWLVNDNCQDLLTGDPDIDEIVVFERRRLGRAWKSADAARALIGFVRRLRQARYDWVIDLQGLFRSGFFSRMTAAGVRAGFANAREGAWLFYTHKHRPRAQHTVDRNIELAGMLGLDARREDLTLHLSQDAKAFAGGFLSRPEVSGGPYVIFVPPTRWATKLYPERHWRTVAAAVADRVPVAVIGTKADAELCDSVAEAGGSRAMNLVGKTSIAQMVGLIAEAACVVCSDSAAMHIAQAVGTDVVALIGPTRVERTGPIAGGTCLTADVPCQGCLRKRCRHITCMQAIEPQTVIEAVKRTLAGRSDSCRSVT